MKPLNPVLLSGKEVLPLIEGGKGINVSTGKSCGAWAKANAVGTFSGVNPDDFDADGNSVAPVYLGRTRKERFEELVRLGIKGGIAQARIAHDISAGNGAIHLNVLWEMGGAERILLGVLEGAKGLVHGITCGAGMPYKVAEIAAAYNVYYYPIVSSARAFKALWKRAYSKQAKLLGGVVYEDPWLAGGHNGLSNSEDPLKPEAPYGRVRELRQVMNECGLNQVPVIMAGGVWALKDWENWIDNPEIGPLAFQFGTRPLLTQESPISPEWKKKLTTLAPGDVLLHRFSPTGFYSSAVKNNFINELVQRSARQVSFTTEPLEEHTEALATGIRGRMFYLTHKGREEAERFIAQGFTETMRTPDSTLIFVTPEKAVEIREDQAACTGCLSACLFSNWAANETGTTGKKADPRSFCIQKTLQNIGHGGSVENELMFAGHYVYRFAQDPYYANGFVPTVQQLIDRLLTGL